MFTPLTGISFVLDIQDQYWPDKEQMSGTVHVMLEEDSYLTPNIKARVFKMIDQESLEEKEILLLHVSISFVLKVLDSF